MGFLWDLIQHNQIQDQRRQADTLEARVTKLEEEQLQTRKLLQTLLERLEAKFGEDIDKDGRIG